MDIDIDDFPADRYEFLFDWNRKAVGHGHALFCSFPPEVASEMAKVGPPVIPYMAFEGDKASGFARDLCNGSSFAKVWVVHPFVRDALIAAGTEPGRIHVAPPALFGGPWKGMHRDPSDASKPYRPFTFGAMGTWHERKGFPDLIRAYFGAFARTDEVQLVIRTSAFGKKMTIREFKDHLTTEIAKIAAEFGDDDFPASKRQPRLRLELGTDATDQEIIEWLGDLDCFAGPSYGEGLGIPHVWAKGQGVPVVATSFGAVGDMLASVAAAGGTDDEVVPHRLAPVDAEMLQIALMFDSETRWGAYDVRDFGAAMVMQFERGRRSDAVGAEHVRGMYSDEAAAAAVRAGLAEILDPEVLRRWSGAEGE
jgi:glycosyltransferase involved in cell wall biosynthesis